MSMILLTRMLNNPCPKSDQKTPSAQLNANHQDFLKCAPGLVRKTTKASVVYAVDDGRLHRVTTPDQTIDYTDCERSTEAGIAIIRPRAGAGVSVTVQSSDAYRRERFRGVAGGDFFVQLFVSRDSFAAFLPVKDTLVELGLEYEVLITEDNDVKLVLGTSERESFVQ